MCYPVARPRERALAPARAFAHALTRALDQNVQVLRLGQFLSNYKGKRLQTSDLAYTYIWGRPTETREPYLMLTYISWFTALRKTVQLQVSFSVTEAARGFIQCQ